MSNPVPESSAGGNPGQGGTGRGRWPLVPGDSLQSPYSPPPLGDRDRAILVYALTTEDLFTRTALTHPISTKTDKKKLLNVYNPEKNPFTHSVPCMYVYTLNTGGIIPRILCG